jgi:1-pyrroline-5-carboxylate dehydrogenase
MARWNRADSADGRGGARASGTNDKAGSILNLVRWISPRTIKETFAPPHAFEYPFIAEK